MKNDEKNSQYCSIKNEKEIACFGKYRGFVKSKVTHVIIIQPKENDPDDKEEAASCCHVIIEEASRPEVVEEDAEEAPST